jgi:thiol:disulfide interchange protein
LPRGTSEREQHRSRFGIFVAGGALAQTPAASPPPAGPTIGFMHAIHATNSVDKTRAFYTCASGMAIPWLTSRSC